MIADHTLHLVLNVERFPLERARRLVIEVASAGVTVLQLRCKQWPLRRFLSYAEAIRDALKGRVPLIIDDRVDLVLATGADGVHLGVDDMPLPTARRLLGEQKDVGGTLTSNHLGGRVDLSGATYVGIGPVFPTRSKTDAPAPMGIDGLSRLSGAAGIPAVAIGGVRADCVPEIMATGVHGVAVVSAICESPLPAESAAKLAQLVRDHRVSRDTPRSR